MVNPSPLPSTPPPPPNCYKLNFDATFFLYQAETRYGAIIRNDIGEFMASHSIKGLLTIENEKGSIISL